MRGSFAIFIANLYFLPSFSSSAITQSVMQGMHFAYKQSIIACGRTQRERERENEKEREREMEIACGRRKREAGERKCNGCSVMLASIPVFF